MKVILISQGNASTGINKYAINTFKSIEEFSRIYFLKFRTTHGKYPYGEMIEGSFHYGSSILNLNSLFPKMAFKNFVNYVNEEKRKGTIVHIISPHVLPIIKSEDNVVTIHDVYPILNPNESVEMKIINHFYKVYLKFDNILTNSKYIADQIEKLGVRGKVKTIYPYVSDNFHPLFKMKELREKYSLPLDKILILSVSTDIPRKNLKAQTRVMDRLDDNYRLVRIGPGIENAIHLFPKNEVEMNEIYNACNIFISTSIDEGFGYPVVEAMKSGLPVVISDIPVHREIAESFGNYFDPDNVRDAVNKIKDVSNSELFEYSKIKGVIKKFSVEKFRTGIINYYHSYLPQQNMEHFS